MDVKDMQDNSSLPRVSTGKAFDALLSGRSSFDPQLLRSALVPAHVDANLASEFHDRLIKWINDFDSSLDLDYEVGIRLVSFGQEVTFHLSDIGYWNPSLISFSGYTEEGDPVELIQHVTQISILLKKMKRADPTIPKRPIGFNQDGTGLPG